MKFILAKKLEMSQRFKDDGTVVPVTVLQAGPCTVTQVKNADKDGYVAVQLGFDETKKKLGKPLSGHLKAAAKNFKTLREFHVEKPDAFKVGDTIDASTFAAGEFVKVIGTSKGKGFQGVVKRHHFRGGPASHGHKDNLRMPGSIGSGGMQRVFKGLRMGGRMGGERVTVSNLEIVAVDAAKGLLTVKGAVPGARGGLVFVTGKGATKRQSW
ncbi:50S ribosomal protein L3 [Candidatus Uhrbacteria bacterium]|nr:50S ribosomal protein L3 [Candidatus Uhrbacteria bacterium]